MNTSLFRTLAYPAIRSARFSPVDSLVVKNYTTRNPAIHRLERLQRDIFA